MATDILKPSFFKSIIADTAERRDVSAEESKSTRVQASESIVMDVDDSIAEPNERSEKSPKRRKSSIDRSAKNIQITFRTSANADNNN